MSGKTLTLCLALLAAIVASYDGLPGNLVNMASSPDSISELRVQAGLAIATDHTARVDVNRKAGTVGATIEAVAPAAQAQADGNPVTNANYQRYPQCDPGSLVYSVLQNGVQPRNEMSASTLGDL